MKKETNTKDFCKAILNPTIVKVCTHTHSSHTTHRHINSHTETYPGIHTQAHTHMHMHTETDRQGRDDV